MSEVFDIQQQWFDSFGGLLVGGKVYYGLPKESTKDNLIDVFANRDFSVSLPNPQVIGADGRVVGKPWLNQRYSILVEDKDFVQVFESDDNGESPVSTGVTIPLGTVVGNNAITANATPAITGYENLQIFSLITVGANTGNMTVNVDGKGAIPLRINGQEIPPGGILGNLAIEFTYNAVIPQFDFLGAISSASPGPIGTTNPGLFTGTTITANTELVGPLGTLTTANPVKSTTLEATTSIQVASGQVITTLGDIAPLANSDVKVPTNTTVKEYADGLGPFGKVLQIVTTEFNGFASTTNLIPADNTIPQSNEGFEFMGLIITPISTTSKLIIQVVVLGSTQQSVPSVGGFCVALFRDTSANAFAATFARDGGNESQGPNMSVSLNSSVSSISTALTTFKVRMGNANAGTFYFNARANGAVFGTANKSSIIITEVLV